MNPLEMMRQAQQLQERLQKEMSTLRVEGEAGGGMVTVVVNGHKHIQKLTIDPDAISKDEVEMLQDLVMAAVNDALRKVDDELKSKVGGMMSGFKLPGLRGRRSAVHGLRYARGGEVRGHSLISDALVSLPASLQNLVDQFKRLPGIGAKSAQRLAFHVLKTPREEAERLCDAIRDVKDKVTYCSVCNNITDADPCTFCADSARDHRIICVVEEPQNVQVIEKSGGYRGVYHVLLGALSPLQGIGPDDLKIKGLLARLNADGGEEIILATNPTVEGEATAIYLARLLKPLGVRVTRIAMGIPVGSDLEYTDELTMGRAMEGRREL